MVAAPHKKKTSKCKTTQSFWIHRTFHLKNDSDSDKIDSSHESGKNVIPWA
jgi:hypothetical protein